jgi:hypothetical protein
MATLPVTTPTVTGTVPTAPSAAAGGGDVFPAVQGAHYLLRIINGSGAGITVTVDDPTTQSPSGATAFNPDLAKLIAAGTEQMFNLSERDVTRFRNPANGNIALSYSGVTSLTVQVIRVS